MIVIEHGNNAASCAAEAGNKSSASGGKIIKEEVPAIQENGQTTTSPTIIVIEHGKNAASCAAEAGNKSSASGTKTVKKEVSAIRENSNAGKNESDKQAIQTKDSIVTVPCKIPNGKWEMITFDLAAVRERKTGLFDVTTEIQTSFLGRGSFATDVQSLTGK